MDFKNNIDSIFEPKTIFEYDIDDFTKEEIEVIKIYCEKFLKILQYPHSTLKLIEIPQPRRIEISDQLQVGFERLKQKGLTSNNGLRLRTYIYYEKFIKNKLNYIILLCKLLNYIEEYHRQHIGDPFDDTFFNRIPISPHYKVSFLLALLEDLELIYRSTELLTGNLITIDLTSRGNEILSAFCPYWNFKTLMKLVNDTKETFLFEPYNNIRVRIVAYNAEGISNLPEDQPINEILYFRIDFTDKDLGQKEPIFSIHNQVGLFEEILHFNDLETRLEINPFLKYNFNNYTLEFVYPVSPYFYYNKFKEKIKGNFDCSRVSCNDLINFIFFDHLNQIRGMEFSYRDFENIEFRGEDGSLSNITDKVNSFMDINLGALDQPNLTIVFPIKSFKFPEPKFEEIEGKRYIELGWDVDKRYLTSFRCKTIINGITYDIPPEGLKKEIKNLNQREYIIKIQWCGDNEFYPLDNELTRVEYKNPYYQSIKLNSHTLDQINQTYIKTNREIIIESLIKCIYQFQQKIQSIQKSEDHYSGILSQFIHNSIEHRSWHIEEQKPSGMSASAEERKFDHIGGLGKLDFVFIDEKNVLLTICEALILKSNVKKIIEEHLLKIFKYDRIGLPFNFIIIYSKAVKFDELWSNYQETVLKTPFNFKLKEKQFFDESKQYDIRSELRMGKTIHIRQGEPMDLYHFLINTSI
ncbi:MAG: hypothetical protein V3V33_15875 [Candidatus Lokiarchaeia archaeon]